MATSGSVDFNLNMADVIEEAYERCGLELRTGYDAATARPVSYTHLRAHETRHVYKRQL